MTDKNYTPLEVTYKELQLDQTGVETLGAILSSNTITEAADKLGVYRSTVYDRIVRYGIDKIIDEIPKQALASLKIGSVKAANTLVSELSNSKNKLVAAVEILDRVGVKSNNEGISVQVNNFIKNEKNEFGI